jgi:hypothetical protein
MKFTTMEQVKQANKARGQHWFDADTMEYWGTEIHGEPMAGEFFITSEDNFNKDARFFTIRKVSDTGRISTVGRWQEYATLKEAEEQVAIIVMTM